MATARAMARPLEIENELLEQRRIWAAGIKAARDQEAQELTAIRLEEERASRAVSDLQAQLDRAKSTLSEVRIRGSVVSDRTRRIVDEYEAKLRETPSPLINLFRNKLIQLRSTLAGQIAHREGRNALGRSVIDESTGPAVQAAAQRIGKILTSELPQLEIQAISEEQLQERLRELELSIPEIEFRKV